MDRGFRGSTECIEIGIPPAWSPVRVESALAKDLVVRWASVLAGGADRHHNAPFQTFLSHMKPHRIAGTLLATSFLVISHAAGAESPKPPGLPTAHTTRNIEGWNVRVDDRLLNGDGAAVGVRALKLLTARLVAITIVVPEKSLAKLRAITVEMDLNCGDLHAMQYHPDAGWLKDHGYSEQLAKCAHIPDVESFLSPFENHRMPWVVLHELAHGFHDQAIGFDDARVTAAWKKFCESGKYKSVLTSPGHMREHYGLTNPKEFFAEMTEAYFGSNDFYPFVTGELKQAEPETFALLEEIWGPLPGRTQAKPAPKK